MEKKLEQMFEYQRFAGNKKLESMLYAAENRYPVQLSDEDLDFVNAAGTRRISDTESKTRKMRILEE